MGLRSGLWAGQSSSSTQSRKTISVWTSLCARRHCHVETAKGLPQTVATKLEAQNCLECHSVLHRLDFSSLELRGLAQNMKYSSRPIFLLHQTLQLALCIGAGSILLTSTKPRWICRTARWWSMIHHSRERVSTAPESNGGGTLHHSSRRLALRMVILTLCAAARPWKPISWSTRQTAYFKQHTET
jgi:hypothetical protein